MIKSTERRRSREKALRKTAILEAAEKVFARKGFDDTIMDDIAEEAELSKGTLYLYYSGKEELVFAILHKTIRLLHGMILTAADGESRGIDKVRGIMRAYLTFFREQFDVRNDRVSPKRLYLSRIFAYFLKTGGAGRPNAEKCRTAIDDIIDVIAEAIRDGIEDGSVRRGADPIKTAVTCGNLVLLFMMRLSQGEELVIPGNGYSAETLLNHMFEMFTHSLESV